MIRGTSALSPTDVQAPLWTALHSEASKAKHDFRVSVFSLPVPIGERALTLEGRICISVLEQIYL